MGGGIRRSHTYARVYLVLRLVLGTHFARRDLQEAVTPPVQIRGPRKKSAEIFCGAPLAERRVFRLRTNECRVKRTLFRSYY